MRLVSHAIAQGPAVGLLRDGHVFAIRDVPQGGLTGLVRDGLPSALEPVEDGGLALDQVELLAPIGDPGKILCIGLNYRGHAEEQGAEPPQTPTFFAKFANALRPSGAIVELPR